MDFIKGFIVSPAGISIICLLVGYLVTLIIKFIKKTENKIDDKLLEIFVGVLEYTLKEAELDDRIEEILGEVLKKMKDVPEDTKAIEIQLEKRLDVVKKN